MNRAGILKMLGAYGLTPFQTRVLRATLSIHRGEPRTYKHKAAIEGRPKAYRAVGTVLKNNPLAPMIPCHRVVKSDGSIGNYSGRGGRRGKLRLLSAEGAV